MLTNQQRANHESFTRRNYVNRVRRTYSFILQVFIVDNEANDFRMM